MVSTYTTRLRLELQAAGDNIDTWGDVMNDVLDRVDESVAGVAVIDCSTPSTIVLTIVDGEADQSRVAILNFTGTRTGNVVIVVPDGSKLYTLVDSSAGTGTLTIRTASGTESDIALGVASSVAVVGTVILPVAAPTPAQPLSLVAESDFTNVASILINEASMASFDELSLILTIDVASAALATNVVLNSDVTGYRYGAFTVSTFDNLTPSSSNAATSIPLNPRATTAGGDCTYSAILTNTGAFHVSGMFRRATSANGNVQVDGILPGVTSIAEVLINTGSATCSGHYRLTGVRYS